MSFVKHVYMHIDFVYIYSIRMWICRHANCFLYWKPTAIIHYYFVIEYLLVL